MLWPGVFDLLTQPESTSTMQTAESMESQNGLLKKITRVDWLGQTIASSCWIISVFVYESDASLWATGDWLQLAAASSWSIANIASLFTSE